MAFDLITIGRSNMDLFAREIGAAFVDIANFEAQVGGSPTNIAMGAAVLGLKSAALTAVGHDKVGDFIIRYIAKKGVDTSLVRRKPGTSSMAVVGVQQPDNFPLLFYRENPPDIWLDVDDMPDFAETKAFLISGTALARGSCAQATIYAAEQARAAGCTVWLDLDLRPDEWAHPMGYGSMMRQILPLIDVAIGTEEEFWAAINDNPAKWHGHAAVDDAERAHVEQVAQKLAMMGQTVVLKRGKKGVTIYDPNAGVLDIPSYVVEVVNTVGAGDAFASGLIYGRQQGWGWLESGRFANGCGAIVVTRHGCAEALPTLEEVTAFLEKQG